MMGDRMRSSEYVGLGVGSMMVESGHRHFICQIDCESSAKRGQNLHICMGIQLHDAAFESSRS